MLASGLEVIYTYDKREATKSTGCFSDWTSARPRSRRPSSTRPARALPRPGADALAAGRHGAELDPDELLAAALEAARAALRRPTRSIGIGVASMAETGVLTDDALRPVVPSIAWYDTRGAEEAERIAAELPEFAERTGQPPSAMCTLAKYAWMRRHWPDAERGTRWLNVAEWIVLGLGGEPGAGGLAGLAHRLLRPAHRHARGRRRWRGRTRRRRSRRRTRRRARRSAARERDARRGRAQRRAGAAAARGRACSRSAATTTRRPRSARARRARATCSTRAAPPRRSCARPRRSTPRPSRRAVADGFTVGRHALAGPLRPPGRVLVRRAAAGGHAIVTARTRRGVPSTALEEAGAAGADVLARMEALAGPRKRLVVTGGWSEGAEARAVKRRHLGPFEHVAEGYAGCRGAALRAAASRGS